MNHSRAKEPLTLPYMGASLLGRGHFTFHTTYFNRRTAVPCRLQIWIKCVFEDETFSPFQATVLLIWLIDTHTFAYALEIRRPFCFSAQMRWEHWWGGFWSDLESAEKITRQIVPWSAYLHDNWALAFSQSIRGEFGADGSNANSSLTIAFDCAMMMVIMLMNLFLWVISFMRIPALCKCP